MTKFGRVCEQVREVLLTKVTYTNKQSIAQVYAELDFQWLKAYCGLPWLDREVFDALWPNLHKLSTVERAARKEWEIARLNNSNTQLPPHLESQRQMRASEWRQELGRGTA